MGQRSFTREFKLEATEEANLKLQGCECPPETAGHHIAPKKAGGDGGDRLRTCLKNAGIDIDWAGNGI